MDVKGVSVYLAAAYGLGYAAQIGGLYLGLIDLRDPSLMQAAFAMATLFSPAIAVFIATQAAPNPALTLPRTWPAPTAPAVRIVAAVFAGFIVFYGATALAGLAEPQWRMGVLVNQLDAMATQYRLPPITPEVKAMVPFVALTAGPLIGILLGVSLFAAIAWGSEIGWRGYLLPRLLPLGRVPAYLIAGLLWALWFVPLAIAWYGGLGDPRLYILLGQLALFGVCYGAFLGEILRGSNHLGLVALAAGCFAGQAVGVWERLFQFDSVPFTGPIGVASSVVWLLLAFAGAPLARSPGKPA